MSARENSTQPSLVADDGMGDDLSLQSLLIAAWRGRWILLICTTAGVVFGVRQIQQQGDIWKAESRLSVQGDAPTVMGIDGLLSSGARNFANTQAAVIRSVNLLKSVVVRPEVAASSIFEDEPNKVGWLRENVDVKVGRDDDIISVSLKSANVAQACVAVNAIVEEYRVQVGQRGETTVRDTLDVLSTQKSRLETALDGRQKDKDAFLEENSLVALDPEGAGRFEIEQLNLFRQRLVEAERLEHEAKARLDEARLLTDSYDVLVQFVGDAGRLLSYQRAEPIDPAYLDLLGDIDQAEDEIERLGARRIELVAGYDMTDEHPALKQLDQQLAAQGGRLARLAEERDTFQSSEESTTTTEEQAKVAQILAVLTKRAEAATALVAEEAQRVADQRVIAARAGDLQTEFRRLDSRVEQSLEAIDDVSANIRSLNLAEIGSENLTAMSVDVLDPATLDTAELASSKTRTLAQFLILGLLAGGALTWVRTMLDQRLRSEEDLARVVPAPLLGVLPKTRINEDKVDAVRAWTEHRALAEAARGLRTAVYFSLPTEEGTILHLTSPEKGDGKSTTTAYLAIAMAQAGQTVLVIDADLRSPRQQRVFGLSNEVGLSDALIDTSRPLSEMIQKTELVGLDVLTTGPIPSAPAEMLNSRRFEQLLTGLAGIYDRIIVDSPPVLAVTDSRVIATKCDATILVTRVDKSTRNSTGAAYERIASVGARVLGVVLNAMPTGIGYGYGAGYGYGYGSKYGDPIPESRPRVESQAWRATESNGSSGPFDDRTSEAPVLAAPTPASAKPSTPRAHRPDPAKPKDTSTAQSSRPSEDASNPTAEPKRVTPAESRRRKQGRRSR